MRKAYAFLSFICALVCLLDIKMVTAGDSLIERQNCLQNPHKTISFDQSKDGDAAYRYIYKNIFVNGFVMSVACTIGYDNHTAIILVGEKRYKVSVIDGKVKYFREIRS